jgi:hypothetical protein
MMNNYFPFKIRFYLTFPVHILLFQVVILNISWTGIAGQVWMSGYDVTFISVWIRLDIG